MEYIREYCLASNVAIVRSNTYAKSLQHTNDMAQILVDDFGVSPNDIRIVLYAGRSYAKTLGVEVVVGDQDIPSKYREVSSLELYYG